VRAVLPAPVSCCQLGPQEAVAQASIIVSTAPSCPQVLYSSSTDAGVRVWDLTTMACRHILHGHRKPVTQLQLAGGMLYTAAAGGVVCVWRTDTHTCVDRFRTSRYSGGIRCMNVGCGARAVMQDREGLGHVCMWREWTCVTERPEGGCKPVSKQAHHTSWQWSGMVASIAPALTKCFSVLHCSAPPGRRTRLLLTGVGRRLHLHWSHGHDRQVL
jgi:WD40 repeat protein